MSSRNAYIIESDLALMSSADFNWIVLVRTDQVKVSLFFFFFHLFIAKALQHYIWLVWLVKNDHFDDSRIFQHDILGQNLLADFAFEFREVVGGRHSDNFLLNLTVDPILQAAHMNNLTTSFTLTWIDQWILRRAFLAKTNLTTSSQLFSNLIHVLI